MTKPKVSIIVPCKGRLDQLRECLPSWRGQTEKNIEIIVVDYGCPDGTHDYVASLGNKSIHCHKEQARPGEWNLNKARNAGYPHAKAEVLLFLDADTVLAPGFVKDALALLDANTFLTGLTSEPWNGCGCLMVRKKDFVWVRGYNELMEGWGYDDIDMYNRLEGSGLGHAYFDPSLISNNPHAPETRNRFHGNEDQYATLHRNKEISDSGRFRSSIPTGKHVTFYNPGVNPEVKAYQKRVFRYFGLEITQIETEMPHDEALTSYMGEAKDYGRLSIWDIDAIPTTSQLPFDDENLCGIAQQAHHIEGKPIYVGVAFITFTEEMFDSWGRPVFFASGKHDTGGEVTEAAGGFGNCRSLWPLHVEKPKWDLGPNSTFGLGTTYQGGIYHAFELRMGNDRMFIQKCKEVLDGK